MRFAQKWPVEITSREILLLLYCEHNSVLVLFYLSPINTRVFFTQLSVSVYFCHLCSAVLLSLIISLQYSSAEAGSYLVYYNTYRSGIDFIADCQKTVLLVIPG